MTETQTPAPELAACPWSCPEHKLIVAYTRISDDVQWWGVECGFCHSNGPQRATESEAVRAWNIRPTPASDREGLLERCAKAAFAADMGSDDGTLPEWAIPWDEQDETEYHDYRERCRRAARAILAQLPAERDYARGVEDAAHKGDETWNRDATTADGISVSVRALMNEIGKDLRIPTDITCLVFQAAKRVSHGARAPTPTLADHRERTLAEAEAWRAASLAASPMPEINHDH